MSCSEITELYKMRWGIEVFFKFLKQELNFSHLINRSENGIRILLYMTMIAPILLFVYKAQNKLSGYKIMKQRFVQDIEKLIAKDLVIMCGGDSDKADKILNINSSYLPNTCSGDTNRSGTIQDSFAVLRSEGLLRRMTMQTQIPRPAATLFVKCESNHVGFRV
jgi:hypothetical protein